MSGNIPIDNPAIRTYWIAYENSMKQVVEGYGFVDPHQKLLSKWFIERSEEHTSELRHRCNSYAVFCLKKKKI